VNLVQVTAEVLYYIDMRTHISWSESYHMGLVATQAPFFHLRS